LINLRQSMIRYLCYLTLAGLTVLASCKSKNESASTEQESAAPEKPASIRDFSNKLQVLVKSDSGVFRNVAFGIPVADIKKMEDTASLVENGENYVNYTIHLDSLEDADVLYYFDEDGKIERIETDIYPDGEKSRTELYKEFTAFFNKKYGAPSSEIEEVKIWNVPGDNLAIEMRMLGNTKVHDLQIDFKVLKEQSVQ